MHVSSITQSTPKMTMIHDEEQSGVIGLYIQLAIT